MSKDNYSGVGFTLWLTGLSGAGKSTIARILAADLSALGLRVEVLDGDQVRAHLSDNLGFSKEDRDRNIRRIGWLCEMLNRHGVVAIVAAISPYRSVRDELRERIPQFIEVAVECPLDVLIARDPKSLYQRALAGEIPHFTGISDPYEPPMTPEVVCSTGDGSSPIESAKKVLTYLIDRQLIPGAD